MCPSLDVWMQAVYEDAPASRYRVLSSVATEGQTVRVIACDCRMSCDEGEPYCSFCRCTCKHCGGSRFAPRSNGACGSSWVGACWRRVSVYV